MNIPTDSSHSLIMSCSVLKCYIVSDRDYCISACHQLLSCTVSMSNSI